MSYGIVCEHPGCSKFATARSDSKATTVCSYCDQHAPTDGQPLAVIRHEDHERYMDNDTMRRMLAPRRVATVGPARVLALAAMLGMQDYQRPVLVSVLERDDTRERLAAEALAKAEAKRARKAARLQGGSR